MTLQEKAREWRENYEMRVLGGPIGEIALVHDMELAVRDFDAALTALLESVRREALEEAARLCEGDDIDYQFRGTRHSPTIFNREMFAWAIRARSRATTKEPA